MYYIGVSQYPKTIERKYAINVAVQVGHYGKDDDGVCEKEREKNSKHQITERQRINAAIFLFDVILKRRGALTSIDGTDLT